MMNEKIEKLKIWIKENPKKVYFYLLCFCGVSLSLGIITEIYMPKKSIGSDFFPSLYAESDKVIAMDKEKEYKKNLILQEIKGFGKKREEKTLTKDDSLRIEFLMSEYNKLKK